MHWTRLDLPQADVCWTPAFTDRDTADHWLDALLRDIPWAQRAITLFGRRVMQPRRLCWMGDPAAHYRYSGDSLAPLPWSETVHDIRERAEAACGTSFNSVLLNLYRDGDDCMGWHADDEPELGTAPVIASVSLGACRSFRLRPKVRGTAEPITVELPHGSGLCMRGTTQAHWQHSVPRRRRVTTPRVNLTFRQVQPRR